MMKFAEKEDVFVQNIGKEITNEKWLKIYTTKL
jgi:hypothetical protein